MQAPLQVRNDSDAVQMDTARTVAQKRVLAENGPEAVAKRKLAEMMNNSPRVLQQRALSDAIHNSPRMVVQRHEMNALFGEAVKPEADGAMPGEASLAQREEKTNKTGLSNQLKSGIESLSGMSMNHVTVHYNSDKPAQLQAHAYAQGSEIYLGAGQERHLPHEAWHVVQQAQGRVRPTLQMKAGAINDDPSLEKEADMMGEKAAQFEGDQGARNLLAEERVAGAVSQRVTGFSTAASAPVQTVALQRRTNFVQQRGIADGGLERKADLMGNIAGKFDDKIANRVAQRIVETPCNSAGAGMRPMQFASNAGVIQYYKHAGVGTMIHHAPSTVEPTPIDSVNKISYKRNAVLGSRRGEIKDQSNGTHSWDFAQLVARIVAIRKKVGLAPGALPVVVNANCMISPGVETSPENCQDDENQVYTFSSVWGMDYKLPKKSTADDAAALSNETSETNASDYATALSQWTEAKDEEQSGRSKTLPLGDKAKSLLRSHAKDLVGESRNDVIPHRGLRNLILQMPAFHAELEEIEKQADFVHIITLDSDMDLGSGQVLEQLAKLAEEHIAPEGEKGLGGLHIAASDYVYEREELFQWLAGALDKVGRKKLEETHSIDAYPAEPGLTISYSTTIGNSARAFIGSNPFGPEYKGDPREGEGGFKGLVESKQSVEGKNIRERWRQTFGDPDAMIRRTSAYVNVTESAGQIKGHGPTLKIIASLYNEKKPITAGLIQKLISSDSYHSLTRDRNSKEKQAAQLKIVEEVTAKLNQLLTDHNFPEDTQKIKEVLTQQLVRYMENEI